jgi:SAM-dependent methyltransferase
MDTLEKARIHYYHQHCLHKDEPAQHVGWTSTEAQINRFEALCAFRDLSGKVLLDVGCGTGDLKAFLDKRFKNFTYLGIDLIPAFIEKARIRFPEKENTFFIQADFITDGLPEVDHIVASGALSYQTTDLLFHYSAIVKLFSRAKRSLSFNLLDAEATAPSPWLKAYDKNEVLAFCKRLTVNTALITGYEDDDFTIVMNK